jgi:hypothetical protein
VLDFVERQTTLNEKHQQVIEKISGLVNQSTTVVVLGRDNRFGALLSDFLENLVQSLIE